MKKINFQNLDKKNYWIVLILLSLVLILIGFTAPLDSVPPKTYKYIIACGFFMQTLYFSRLFWYKNTVQWNGKGIVIRINSFFGVSLRFDDIQTTVLDNKLLTITKTNNRKITIDLSDILKTDALKLQQIMIDNI